MERATTSGRPGPRRSKQGDDLILSDTMDGETVVGSGRSGLLGKNDSLKIDTHFSPSSSSGAMSSRRKTGAGPIMSSVDHGHRSRRHRGHHEHHKPSFLQEPTPDASALSQQSSQHHTALAPSGSRRLDHHTPSRHTDLAPTDFATLADPAPTRTKRSPSNGFESETNLQHSESVKSHKDPPTLHSRRTPSGGFDTDLSLLTEPKSVSHSKGSLGGGLDPQHPTEKDAKMPSPPFARKTSSRVFSTDATPLASSDAKSEEPEFGTSQKPPGASGSRENHGPRHRKDSKDYLAYFPFAKKDQNDERHGKPPTPALTEEQEIFKPDVIDPRNLPKIQKSTPRKKDDSLDFETALGKLMRAKKLVGGRRTSQQEEEESGTYHYNVANSSIAHTDQPARHSLSATDGIPEEDKTQPEQKHSVVDLAAKGQELLRKHPPELPSRKMDQRTAIGLKTVIFGTGGINFNEEWRGQSFTFCDLPRLQYGFYQKKGGPCGVLASIQAAMLQELLFHGKTNEASPARLEPSKAERSAALARGLAKVFWRAGEESKTAQVVLPTNNPHFLPTGLLKRDGFTERLTIYTASNMDELIAFLQFNIGYYEAESNSGVILALYSAILSRTVEKVQEDMDQHNNTLMGAHGYCTQELVNLLVTGRATSNVFNDVIELDSGGAGLTVLKGIHGRSDIGLLSLYEHYRSCQVGTFLKTPRYPIWVICSESHFSVLFCLKKQLLNDWRMEKHFDLYYYDGLARQDHEIRLSINTTNRFYKPVDDEDLVPPLEHCIRTKWRDAEVDWNGTEPLL